MSKIILSNNNDKKTSDYFRQFALQSQFNSSESWVILNKIEQSIKAKIEAIGTPLKNWNININRGVITGLNEAFIITGEKRDELIKEDPKSAEIIRPILRGKDIKRYGYTFSNIYVILAYYGSYKIIPEKYPAIYKHLKKYEVALKNRGQCRYLSNGKPNVNPNVEFVGQHHWLELDNNPTLQKLEDFYKQKIVWGEISDKTKFSIELEGKYFNEATTFFMIGESLLYLVAYLNSRLSEYFFSKIGTTTGVGTIRWKKFTIEQLVVPKLPIKRQLEYEKIILKILKRIENQQDYLDLSNLINQMIYKEFNFTNEEIEFIEIQ